MDAVRIDASRQTGIAFPSRRVAPIENEEVEECAIETQYLDDAPVIEVVSGREAVQDSDSQSSGSITSRCCYVCEDDDGRPIYAVCRCTDRLLHLQCQEAMIRKTLSHQLGCCPICQSRYTNVEITVSSRRLSIWGKRFAAFILGNILIVAIAAYEIYFYMISSNAIFLGVGIGCILSACFFLGVTRNIFHGVRLVIQSHSIKMTVPQEPAATTAQPGVELGLS